MRIAQALGIALAGGITAGLLGVWCDWSMLATASVGGAFGLLGAYWWINR